MSLLDLAAERWLGMPFDAGGDAAHGQVQEALLSRWLTHPYFQVQRPKSTGREMFGLAWFLAEIPGLEALALPDRLATLAAFTAASVALEAARLTPLPPGTRALVSGGGARHRRVRTELEARLSLPLEDDASFPNGAREAVSWALLGAASALGLPGNLPEVTGATRPVALGSWVWP
jgi:anhydro-N-acetylmuramic acid kinase